MPLMQVGFFSQKIVQDILGFRLLIQGGMGGGFRMIRA
jgi:hypothetical protein